MPHSATQVAPDNEAVLFQLAKMLGEHLLWRPREQPVQLAQSTWSMLKPRQNPRLPFPLNEIDCKLRRALFGILGTIRDSIVAFSFGTGRIRLVLIRLFQGLPTSMRSRITIILFWRTPNHVSPPINPKRDNRNLSRIY